MEIIINDTKIKLIDEFGSTYLGEYYIKENKIYLKSKTALGLSILSKNKNQILEKIK